MIVEILAVLAFAAGAAYDIEQTEIGLKKGVAVEGNTFLVGSKPTVLRLLLRDSLYLSIMVLLGLFVHPALLVGPAIAGGLKHLVGGLKWRNLNNGGKYVRQTTWWRKFLGF